MKIPLSLLQTYLPLNISVETICDTLTLLGIEVDSVTNLEPPFTGVIVGEVLSAVPHPSSEKLQIAEIDTGKETVTVVCGAANCRKGIKTAFAPIGACLKGEDKEPICIQKATIRGSTSFGMLASAKELGLWNDNDGILELPHEFKNGTDLNQLLWDPVLELSLTPNLGHAMSAKGVARELAAALKTKIQIQKVSVKENSNQPIESKIRVHLEDPKLAPIYMGRVIENVTVKPSPFWLQKILLSSGQKPINNIVDVTNYILLKTGHPLHAFDLDKISGKKLTIKMSKNSHKWLGLDGEEKNVNPSNIVIEDDEKVACLAGVIGGQNTATLEGTKNIFLEAASFDPTSIRKSLRAVNTRTQSAIRFEKGVDPITVESALEEAATLIQEIAGGEIAKGVIKIQSNFPAKTISLRTSKASAILGIKLSTDEIENILQSLECKTSLAKDDIINVTVPTYRFDLKEEIDLIEEVIRLYGYNNLEKKRPKFSSSTILHDPSYLFEKKVRNICVGLGLQEMLTSDLISPKMIDQCFEFITSKGIKTLKAIHAKTEEYSILRPSLIPGLLQVAKTNVDLKNLTFHGFEIGRIHFLQNDTCVETPMLSFMISGKNAPSFFGNKENDVDFYDLKGLLENLLIALGIEHFQTPKASHLSFHPGRQADLIAKDHVLGSFGQVHPDLLEKVDIKQDVYYAEINLNELMKLSKRSFKFKTIPHLPSSERDWTYTMDIQTPMAEIFSRIEEYRPKILEKYELIDLFIKNQEFTQNATFRFTYRDLFKTISAVEVEHEHTQMIDKIIKHKK